MLTKLSTAILALILTYAVVYQVQDFSNPQSQFKNWMKQHGKTYTNQQFIYRFGIFKETLQRIKEHNQRADKGLESYTLGINFMSDISFSEFQQKYIQNQMPQGQDNYACTGRQPVVKEMPQSFDWVAKAAVTSVRKVSGCDKAAYAVVTAETIESGRFITTGKLSPASVQQIIDCSSGQGNKGCSDGNVVNSFDYILKHGMTGQAKYPYVDKNGTCSYHTSMREWQILGCVKVTPQNQTMIRTAVFRQPVAASINAGVQKFKDYKDGVFDTSGAIIGGCKVGANHWVTIVGWGVDSSSKKKYWKLKNSWGTSWGVLGYMSIVRTGDGAGECGVQNEIYYALD